MHILPILPETTASATFTSAAAPVATAAEVFTSATSTIAAAAATTAFFDTWYFVFLEHW